MRSRALMGMVYFLAKAPLDEIISHSNKPDKLKIGKLLQLVNVSLKYVGYL